LYSFEKIAQFIDPERIGQPFPLSQAYYRHQSKPFPFKTGPLPGVIYIGDRGKGIYCILVINGPEAGTVWIDERENPADVDSPVIYPRKPISLRFMGKDELSLSEWYKTQKKLTFLEWYLDWLEADIIKIKAKQEKRNSIINQITKNSIEINLKDYHLIELPEIPIELPLVEKIDLMGNKLRSLKGLPVNLPNAKIFSFMENNLLNLDFFPQKVPNLRSLDLTNNPIKNLIGLPSEMPKLEYVYLQLCPLENLQGFPQKCPLLKKLVLSQTSLRTLHYLPRELPNLGKIYLENCHLDNLEGLPQNLPNLSEIRLKGGEIKALTGISDLIKEKIKWN